MANVVKNTEFKSAGDWINEVLEKNCVDKGVGAVAEVKDKEGKVTTPARKGKDIVNVDNLKAIALENQLEFKSYPNPGMARMNVGNMLRAAARKRHGLIIGGKFVKAPEGFTVNAEKTENPDGTKIAKKAEKPETEKAEAKKADAKPKKG